MPNRRIYRQPSPRRRDDGGSESSFGNPNSARPNFSRPSSQQGMGASGGAQDQLGNIDSMLNQNSQSMANLDKVRGERPHIGESEARAAKNRRTDVGARQAMRKDPRSSTAKDLSKKESAAEDKIPYKPEAKKKGKRDQQSWWNNRRTAIAGGLAGLGVGTSFFGMTFLAGPLEFVHLASVLHDAHFSQQENAGDGRMGKLLRYLRANGNAGETRVGWIGSKYHSKIIGKLADIGIEPITSSGEYYEGFKIDTEHENSPYKGMDVEEAAKKFEADYKFKPEIDGKTLKINAKGFWQSKKTLKIALGNLKIGKISTLAGVRNLIKWYGISMHPLSKLDKLAHKGTLAFANWVKEKWKSRTSKGVDPAANVDGTTAQQDEGVDKNGNKTTGPASEADQAAASKAISDPAQTEKTLTGLKTGKIALGGAGIIATVAGIVCALKAVNDTIPAIRYVQVIIPMIRIGMDAMTIGNQIMSGQDVDLQEVSILSKNLSKVVDGKNQSWNDNLQIRAETHQDDHGVDSLKNDGTNDLLSKQYVPWLEWTNNAVLDGLCGTVGSVITGVVSIGIGIISGGAVSAVAGLIAGVAFGGPLIHKAAGLLAGQAIPSDIGALAPAAYGGVADTGSLMGANASALRLGATQLTDKQSMELNEQTWSEHQAEFESKNFFARTFDIFDYRSMVGRMADNLSTSPMANLTTMFNSVIGAGSSTLSLPFNIYGSTVHAGPAPTYKYPVPEVNFSLTDLDNTSVDNPTKNADEVATQLLDSNNANGVPDYIQKAKDCFGVDISKGPDGWDAIPSDAINIYDTKTYDANACRDTSDKNWIKVRFFILDTGIMEGFACAAFNDATSCTNMGFTDGSTKAQSSSDDIVSLATQILATKSITLNASAKADIVATQKNQQIQPGAPTKGQTAADCQPVFLDADLLHGLLTIAQTYQFTIDNFVSGHDCDKGRHPMGRAADIVALKGRGITWAGSDLADDKQFATDAANIMAVQMPTGHLVGGDPVEMAGIGVCHQDDISPPPAGINYYVDSCNKLVIDTGVAGS